MRLMRLTSRNIPAKGRNSLARRFHRRVTFPGKTRSARGRLRQGRRVAGNELLCKVLCHNLCCVIQSMYELGIKPDFGQGA